MKDLGKSRDLVAYLVPYQEAFEDKDIEPVHDLVVKLELL